MRRVRFVVRIVGGVLAVAALYGTSLAFHARQSPLPEKPLSARPPPLALSHSSLPLAVTPSSSVTPSSATAPTDRVFPLTAAPAHVKLFDGRDVAVWAYNGQVPGPTLRVQLGDTVVVPFTNALPQDTTVHWHGVRLPNAMDGVPGVTQAPIRPGEVFTYRFTPKDAGTYWYHPHSHGSEQVERGLYGTLVVEDSRSLPYTQDVVWVLDDWRVDSYGVVDLNFDTKHDVVHDGRWGNVVTVNGRTNESLRVRAGERIRLRLVNTANGRVIAPDFAGLDAKIVAVDGNYSDAPIPAYPFELAPGNRLDLDITIRLDQRGQRFVVVDRYGSAHRPHHHQRHDEDALTPLASIVVLEEVVATPSFPLPSGGPLQLPSDATTALPNATYALRLAGHRGMGMMGGMGSDRPHVGPQWLINGRAFPDFEPTALANGVWTKLRFVNRSSRIHPMHLHGQFFRVVARDGAAALEPFARDTVLVHPNETIDVVLRPVDDGAWMLHCHVLEHAEAGMMTIVNVASGIDAGGL